MQIAMTNGIIVNSNMNSIFAGPSNSTFTEPNEQYAYRLDQWRSWLYYNTRTKVVSDPSWSLEVQRESIRYLVVYRLFTTWDHCFWFQLIALRRRGRAYTALDTNRMQPKAERTTCSDWRTKNLQSSLRLGMWSPNMMINNDPEGFIYSISSGATGRHWLALTGHKEIR